MKKVMDYLDIMDEMLDSALAVPLSGGKCMVNADRFRDLIADIRMNLPKELEEAENIVNRRQQIMETAQREIEAKIKIAEERARRLVDEDEITKKVKERANDMMSQANRQSKELKIAANEFADNILKSTEQGLMDSLTQIRNAKAALKAPVQK
jgi:cell division septum initiation protein DivIVA